MQWPERVCLIISSSCDPCDGMSVMDARIFPAFSPSFFSTGDEFGSRIEIGEIGSWYLLPSVEGVMLVILLYGFGNENEWRVGEITS